MKKIDLTFPTPQENLAFDEALIDWCENGYSDEVLRFWEPREYFVVLGYSNKSAAEVNEISCRNHRIPILRRCSGGGTVLQGPGCLNYSLVLQTDGVASLKNITTSNHTIMTRQKEALERLLGPGVAVKGTTDLALGELKFSGNAQRRKRRHLLFHGTFLLDFDLTMMEKYLAMPELQPAYRLKRAHADFVTNLKLPAESIKKALEAEWKINGALDEIPGEATRQLVESQYSKDEWNRRFSISDFPKNA